MRILNTVDAVREAHELLLAEDKNHIVIGEGVPDPKACFGTTRDLDKKFSEQVFDMPVSENGMTGVCIGAALNGIKPVLIHMRQDFLRINLDFVIETLCESGQLSMSDSLKLMHKLWRSYNPDPWGDDEW